MWFKKKISIRNEETVELEGIQTWMVRWQIRDKHHEVYRRQEAQAFTNERDAESFVSGLESAASLLNIYEDICATIERV